MDEVMTLKDSIAVGRRDLPELRRIGRPLLKWYSVNARVLPWRKDRQPYQIWISEIMLQQTRVEAVKPYYERFMNALPDVCALAECPEEQLLKLWEGLGYYNRARNLQKAAKMVMNDFGGQFPADYEALLTLPGIGSYTAGAVASIAFEIPVPAVDGNVLRVIARIQANREDIGKPQTKKRVESELLELMASDPECGCHPGEFNQALMELGATVCLPNGQPKCDCCPVNRICLSGAKNLNLISEIPVKEKKKARRVEERTVFLFIRENGELGAGEVALQRRPDEGLLAGLWEPPVFIGERLSFEGAADVLADWGIDGEIEELPEAKHIFTHVEWRMRGYLVRLPEKSARLRDWVFADRTACEETYTIPTAYQAYIKYFCRKE